MKPLLTTRNTVFRLLMIVSIGIVCVQCAQVKNVATNATDPNNLADSEPSIAVNPVDPKEIVITTFSEAWTAQQGAPVWRSTDGGQTWAKIFIIPRPGTSSAPNDQKVQFDRNGRLFIAELAGGIAIPRCLIFRQTGAPGTNLTAGAFYGDDQPMLDIDRTPTSGFVDQFYSAWLNFGFTNMLSTVANSNNQGAAVTNVAAGNNANFPNRTTRSAVAIDGSAYIVFKTREGSVGTEFENAHFIVKRSDDGGATWTGLGANGVSVHGNTQVQTWFTSQWGDPASGLVARARSSDAWIAADPGDGDIYVVYCDQDNSNFGQIFLARSTDRGATWTSTRVTNGTRHSAFPEVAVAANGAIGVLYVDRVVTSGKNVYRHRFACSFNSGATWKTETLQTMNTDNLTNAVNGFLWGDYEGLAAEGFYFYGVFTGASIGRTTRQLDPIFFKRPAFRRKRPYNRCKINPLICRVAPLDKSLIKLRCEIEGCKIFDPVPKNCLVKYVCPGCSPTGKCPPPYYILRFEGLDDGWDIELYDPNNNRVKTQMVTDSGKVVLSFQPQKQFTTADGKLGDYMLVFSATKRNVKEKEYNVTTSIEASDVPYQRRQ